MNQNLLPYETWSAISPEVIKQINEISIDNSLQNKIARDISNFKIPVLKLEDCIQKISARGIVYEEEMLKETIKFDKELRKYTPSLNDTKVKLTEKSIRTFLDKETKDLQKRRKIINNSITRLEILQELETETTKIEQTIFSSKKENKNLSSEMIIDLKRGNLGIEEEASILYRDIVEYNPFFMSIRRNRSEKPIKEFLEKEQSRIYDKLIQIGTLERELNKLKEYENKTESIKEILNLLEHKRKNTETEKKQVDSLVKSSPEEIKLQEKDNLSKIPHKTRKFFDTTKSKIKNYFNNIFEFNILGFSGIINPSIVEIKSNNLEKRIISPIITLTQKNPEYVKNSFSRNETTKNYLDELKKQKDNITRYNPSPVMSEQEYLKSTYELLKKDNAEIFMKNKKIPKKHIINEKGINIINPDYQKRDINIKRMKILESRAEILKIKLN